MPNNNAVVNTAPTTSETPSNLVGKGKNKHKKITLDVVDTATNETETKPLGEVHGELSPNPAGFGFTKQVKVDSLVSPGSPDTLYLLAQYDGEGRVKEYFKYRWDVAAFAFKRIFEPVNNVAYKDGEHATPVVENNTPRPAPEKVFTGEVVFNEEPTVEGKKLHEWIDTEGGVTQEELDAALGNYYKKSETYTKTQIDNQLAGKQNTLNTTSAPSGNVVKLLGFDSQGHVVNDDVPAGLVVDDSLDATSDNAVANKPVTRAINSANANITALQAEDTAQNNAINYLAELLNTVIDNFVLRGTLYSSNTTISDNTATIVGTVSGNTVTV